jgi:hypothetical protein
MLLWGYQNLGILPKSAGRLKLNYRYCDTEMQPYQRRKADILRKEDNFMLMNKFWCTHVGILTLVLIFGVSAKRTIPACRCIRHSPKNIYNRRRFDSNIISFFTSF